MNDEPGKPRRRFDWVAPVTLLLLAAVALAAWWGFPRLQAFLSYQDCVATGRNNCGG